MNRFLLTVTIDIDEVEGENLQGALDVHGLTDFIYIYQPTMSAGIVEFVGKVVEREAQDGNTTDS